MTVQNVIRVRCYAERDPNGSWFAICLDLNLYARADSFLAVRHMLEGIVREYVVEAFGKDREYFEDLIPRRAPARFWLKYYAAELLRRLLRRRDDRPDGGAVPFMEQMPLHA
ncbi:MAG: hypothetical protein WBO04_07685 [Steroidobacteraceae bacterium]